MRLLLDTHLLLWAAGAPERLPKRARVLLESPENRLIFSAANLWEIVIKRGLGREDFQVDATTLRLGLLENGYQEIAIDSRHALMVNNLPAIHKDPFDRILIAQAMVEGLTLVTTDGLIGRYPGSILRVGA